MDIEEERRRRRARMGIPSGMSIIEYERISRPPSGLHRELIARDHDAALAQRRFIEQRI